MKTNDETRERRLTNPELAYLHDPDFHALVDMLLCHMHGADFTPSELRKAVLLAAIKFERARPPPVFRIGESDFRSADRPNIGEIQDFEIR